MSYNKRKVFKIEKLIIKMKKIFADISKLLPIDCDKKSRKEVDYKADEIYFGRETQILTIESLVFPEKYYVGDGHHTILGYMELEEDPLIEVIENDDDLRECLRRNRMGAINTTNNENEIASLAFRCSKIWCFQFL